jgi:AcrR family transcriptional regulator
MEVAMSLADTSPPMRVPGRRSTRDRPAKAPLSTDAIVDAALEILRTDGVGAVTMRRVAAALDTGAASLYVYVTGSDGLFQAMLDRVTATIPLEVPDPSNWRAQLHALLERMLRALIAHPGIATMTMSDPPTTEVVLLLTENMLEILAAGGIDPQGAAWTCDILVMLVVAVASEEDARSARGRGADERREQIEELRRTFAALSPERFPFIAAHAEQMVAGDSEERFRFAIDAVIDGAVARAARQ